FKASGTDSYFPFVEAIGPQNLLSVMQAETNLHANQKTERNFLLYLGPNRVSDLQPYELDVVVNFGKMDAICKLLIGGMQAIAHIVKNYGVAIILLTMTTNLVLSPLTKASFMSMQRMQLVQPQIAKLREKYKSDPTKLNHETMAIYRKHKINPMGGCFPMIVQMPIFISLYVALSKSIDLLNAKFLWIKDLASPDVVPLPFSLPLFGDTIHVLPLIMVVAMVMQQKISMASMPQADPTMAQQQKMMMTIMPVFFGFIFYPMPSGLVIYWLTNTIVTTAYQKYLRSQAAPRVPQAA
ncbi:MAG: membrane protein insertase YidC, partial [Candidatus Omnitrophica bacterium]|nr:membrane protein insertase YidC [Candidatus Omnitrophota bacterium]